MNEPSLPAGVVVRHRKAQDYTQILTPGALDFVAGLERTFGTRRTELLRRRDERQAEIDGGRMPDFLADTRSIREDPGWRVGDVPADLQDRRVEITGPVDRKMVINALNSGASAFMADFEDSNSPTFDNNMLGQLNLRDANRRTVSFTNPDGKQYTLNDRVATLLVRPRGWHLDEKHILVDGAPMSGSLVDFGLYLFHNAERLAEIGSGPYFYLPKLENHHEARLWNDVFCAAQDRLGLPRGTIKATVLIENILAAFEMEEILHALREHIVGLNAGRWDYLFSIIKTFRNRPGFLLPDRAQLTMTTPFMRAYSDLLVKTCHRRGAHAMGGMAAFIPNRREPAVTTEALAKVGEDKRRESAAGFDGTWIAHPDLLTVARDPFDAVLGDRPHQKDRLREDVEVGAADLLRFEVDGGRITEQGLRLNISVALQYLESWLGGVGAVGIFNLMEDAATAEISRAQIWQWSHHPTAALADGRKVSADLYHALVPEELARIRELFGEARFAAGRFDEARQLLDRLCTDDAFVNFLTLIAYDLLE